MRGKIVVVTGAASGIGRELARAFFKKYAAVYALDVDKKGLSELSEEASREGLYLHTKLIDVTDREALFAFAKELSQIDIWVNNAGIAHFGSYLEGDHAAFKKLMEINFWGVINGSDAVMQNSKNPTIVNIASVAGILPSPLLTTYAASKHAVVGYTRSLREECRVHKIPAKFVLVMPGFVDTKIIDKRARGVLTQKIKLASPDQVAKEILEALEAGKEEVIVTKNGKAMVATGKIAPFLLRAGFRKLASKMPRS